MAFRPRYPNNLPYGNAKGEQPWPKGQATRTTLQPNNLQPWHFGHALRSKAGLRPSRSTLAKRPRYANNPSTND
ncbi:MAG: hypothetical protein F6J90_01500 [Moorea sp. SIOASIH]|uniref:hypothetical protein n=1 Tax=Moorena sp. SIOASIH TaxID=2607817 RepID=UPI0013B967E4|nr:hypothetical protein [Moorena sp. SIOASIH]NEO35048.1 hypothetical protein [Moorena sp. SIOASIH]